MQIGSSRFRSWIGFLCLALLGGAPFALRAEEASTKGTRNSSARFTARFEDALEVLRRVPSGAILLDRAQNQWGVPLATVFRWGEASKTDAVITRYYNPGTGEERRERKVSIILRKEQPLEDLVLDMAHELVHATARPSWDPYDPRLTPARYIRAAIEGAGGEVDAVVTECKVSLELAQRFGISADRCRRYLGHDLGHGASVSREKVLREFYRIGNWRGELARKLGPESDQLPLLTSENPHLYSSTGHTPYPIALYREYSDLTRMACENSRKRLDLARGPASLSALITPAATDSVASFLKNRCSP